MKKYGWFEKADGSWTWRPYDPEYETPGKGPEDKGIPKAENIGRSSGKSRRLSSSERLGYLIQTGREFNTVGELDSHLKQRGLRLAEKNDGVSEEVERIQNVTGVDPERDVHKVKKEGGIPGIGKPTVSEAKELRKKLKRS